MTDKLVITAALTGHLWHKADNPALPTTAEEIAQDALDCWNAGASMFHLHARDHHGNYSMRAAHYKPVVEAVREAVPGAVVCVSCSGRWNQAFEERSEVLNLDGVDMASLTLGSFNFPSGQASVNEGRVVEALARRMAQNGVTPEMEAFELGHVAAGVRLVEKGLVPPPWVFNLFLGIAVPCTLKVFGFMLDMLPERSVWFGAGGGQHQVTANNWAIALGGHVRTGLEDNLLLNPIQYATNPLLVERAVAVGRAMGREPATCEEARRIIWGAEHE